MVMFLTICCGLFFFFRGLGADVVLPCYEHGDEIVNETLADTIRLSDVILAGRIVSVKRGEFGTHSAVVSYFIAYKDDGFLQQMYYGSVTVTNFIPEPPDGQLGLFFLFRAPSMQLSHFCTVSWIALNSVKDTNYEEILQSIEEVVASKLSSLCA